MIARATGALALRDAAVTPLLTEAEARALGWVPAGAGRHVREAVDTRDRALVVGLRYAGRLAGIELRYAVRRPAEDVHGAPDWEQARKDWHDALLREWFAMSVHDLLYAPPPQPGPLVFGFPWGEVRSDRTVAGGAVIEVRYAVDAG